VPLRSPQEEAQYQETEKKLSEACKELDGLKVRNRSWRSRYIELKNETSIKDGILFSLRRTAEQLRTAIQVQPFIPLGESDLEGVMSSGVVRKEVEQEVELNALEEHRVAIEMLAGSTLCWKFQLQQGIQCGAFNGLASWSAEAVGFRLMKETADEYDDLPWTGMRRSSSGLHGLYTSNAEKPVVGLWGSALSACTVHLVWDNPCSMSERVIRYNVKLLTPAPAASGDGLTPAPAASGDG
jgi:hypothetical protein